jgi:tRNA1(Val) A37 N6-methylase TrmN6
MPQGTSTKPVHAAVDQEAAKARQYFPRGLIQPAGSFRFSADALLLAEFAVTQSTRLLRCLDLGCGCGVAGLGVMLRMPTAQFTGVDICRELTIAATQNAARLGLGERYRAVAGDVREYKDLEEITPGTFDLVVANPPYRKINSGRKPSTDMRLTALFETHGDITAFAAAAAYALKNNGRFCCIYSAQRLPDLCAALAEQNLTPKRLCPVHGRAEDGALLVLVEARRNGKPGLKWSPPILTFTV